jgi:hypothetical protein
MVAKATARLLRPVWGGAALVALSIALDRLALTSGGLAAQGAVGGLGAACALLAVAGAVVSAWLTRTRGAGSAGAPAAAALERPRKPVLILPPPGGPGP